MRRDRHAHQPAIGRVVTAGFLVAALAASLVPGIGPATAQDQVDLALEPAIERHTAARSGQQVAVSGSAPVGDFTAATLIGTTSSGQQLEQPISDSVLNREPPGFGEEDRDHLHNDGGEVTGELTLGPVFQNDADPDLDVRWAELEVTVEDAVTGLTDRVAIDTINPFIRGYELIDDREILVVFSEPVQNPTLTDLELEDGLDLSVDWSVEGSEVLAVADGEEGDCLPRRTNELDRSEDAADHHAGDSGCTRRLILASALDEDARPYVEYAFESRILRESYDDFAGNLLRQAQGAPFSDALDLIRPAEPEILAVDGDAPDDGVVIGNEPAPSVTVANLRDPDEGPAGAHRVRFRIDPGDGQPFETDPVDVDDEEMTVALPELGDDSGVDITAVAVDPHGNRSDEDAKTTVRDDADPTTVTYFLGVPDLAAPRVEQPEDELFTTEDEILVAGGFGDATGPEIGDAVEVLDGSDVIADGEVDGEGRWEVTTPLDADGRFRLEVRALDEGTGATSDAATVPDVVRDTRDPQVDVVYPDEQPLTDSLTERRRTYFVGDRVEVRYEAEDPAEGDDELPDHGDHVEVTVVSDVGQRTVDDDAPYDPGQEVSTSTTIEPDDLDGHGQVEAVFEVAVTDLAGNVGEGGSAEVLLSNGLIGYAAEYVGVADGVEPARIVLEFPVELDVPVLRIDSAHWQVDGDPVTSATYDHEDGATRVTLEVVGLEDPNARPEVQFVADEQDPTRPRGSDGREISLESRRATDRISPELSVEPVDEEYATDVTSVTFSGETDETEWPNHIEVFRLDAEGGPDPGGPVSTTEASQDGDFTIEVPLAPDQRNRLGFEAVDPSGNRSETVVREVVHVSSPELALPRVEWPEEELFTNEDEVVLEGGSEPAEGAEVGDVVEVVDGEEVVADGQVDGDGRWEIPVTLEEDGRFRLEVRAVDTRSGAASAAVEVPDVVRDTSAPEVEVLYPDQRPLTDLLTDPERRRTYFVGDRVEVRYEAEDPAEGDDELPDHGDHVEVTAVSDVGQRTVDDDAPYDPGQEVSTSTTIEPDDLDGHGQVEALFDVTVTDLAGNVGEDSSAEVLLSDELIGYAADYVEAADDSDPARIVLEFPVELDVPVLRIDSAHWQVDGQGVESATYDHEDGATRVTLEVDGLEDPNARPEVQFVADEQDPTRPRGSDGREISSTMRAASDRIRPELAVVPVDEEYVTDVTSVTFAGMTDESQWPNRVEVFRLDVDGEPSPRDPVATTRASADGQFTIEVPLALEQRNRLGVEAVDPSGNRSHTVHRELTHTATPVPPESPVATCPDDGVDAFPYTDRSAIPPVHLDTVDCATFRGIVEGFRDGSFRPREPVYRDQMASFVARMIDTAAGAQSLPAPDASDDEFRDIEGSVHRDNIRRLYAAGIIEGRTRTQYAPRMEVRRDQVATFVLRAAAYARDEHVDEGESGARAFPDVGPDNVHFERVNGAAGIGLVQGHTDGTYRPANSTERAQMASLVVRGLTHVEE